MHPLGALGGDGGGGVRSPRVTLCPGVLAPPASLPGHAHARGDTRASTSHPETQLLGTHGES